jgi:hypothetical protein
MPPKRAQRKLAISRARNAYADRGYDRLRRAIKRTLALQVEEAADNVRRGLAISNQHTIRRWARDLADAQRPHIRAMGKSGWDLAGQELGVKGKSDQSWTAAVPYADGRADDRGSYYGKADPVAVGDKPDNFLQRQSWDSIDKWLKTTSEGASYTTAQRLEKIFKDASEFYDEEKQQGLTPVDIAKQILATGNDMTEARARMLAHTGAIWSYNEGAQERYQAEGVPVCEWLTSDDDLRCPFCADMNGKRVAPGDPFFRAGDVFSIEAGTLKIPGGQTGFDVRHPPLHPNCRCTLIPIVDEAQLED